MSYLPSPYGEKPRSPLAHFIRDHQPDDLEKAKRWRNDLMAALNSYMPPTWSICEHPDSVYMDGTSDD